MYDYEASYVLDRYMKVSGRTRKNITYNNVSVRSTCFSGDTVSVPQVLGQERRLTNPLPQPITGLADQIIEARMIVSNMCIEILKGLTCRNVCMGIKKTLLAIM